MLLSLLMWLCGTRIKNGEDKLVGYTISQRACFLIIYFFSVMKAISPGGDIS